MITFPAKTYEEAEGDYLFAYFLLKFTGTKIPEKKKSYSRFPPGERDKRILEDKNFKTKLDLRFEEEDWPSFNLVGKLKIDGDGVKIIYDESFEEKDKKGFIYIIGIDDHICKIGKTIGTLDSRIDSTNTGQKEYRERKNSTNSITNCRDLKFYKKYLENSVVKIWAFKCPETCPEVTDLAGNSYTEKITIGIDHNEQQAIYIYLDKIGMLPILNFQIPGGKLQYEQRVK